MSADDMYSPPTAPSDPSIGGGSVESAAGGDAEARLRALQAEIDELFEHQRDFDVGSFAVLAWCAGHALACAMEAAWRARGIGEARIDEMMLALHRRRGAKLDA